MHIYVSGHQSTFDKFELVYPRFYIDNSKQYLDHRYYCELAALHKIWKQVLNVDVVGLEHYRRFFVKDEITHNKLVDEQFVYKKLETHDILLSKQTLPYTVMTWFAKERHNVKESREGITRELMYKWWMYVRDNYSKEFMDFAISRMLRYNTYMSCNMFIAKKPVIDAYCEFLFPMLEGFFAEVMKGVPEPRIFGYLSEYLLGYWMKWKGYKVYPTKTILSP